MSDPDRRAVVRYAHGTRSDAVDAVVAEEPLEIRVAGDPLVVVMRTPGRDDELAAGFLFTEGLLRSPRDLGAIQFCRDGDGASLPNVVNVIPALEARFDLLEFKRSFPSGSSCGICGKSSIDRVHRAHAPLADDLRVPASTVLALPERMRAAQALFARNGSIHAAALFDRAGGLVLLREDVGRHNAVDRIVGRRVMDEGLPLAGHILMVSGRVSFEIVQKALAARIPVVAAVSGATSLAIALAESSGMTLAGFVRGDGMNVYCGQERIR